MKVASIFVVGCVLGFFFGVFVVFFLYCYYCLFYFGVFFGFFRLQVCLVFFFLLVLVVFWFFVGGGDFVGVFFPNNKEILLKKPHLGLWHGLMLHCLLFRKPPLQISKFCHVLQPLEMIGQK